MARTKEMIGKYKILEEIGRGGMGAVYKAIHPTLKKTIILKQLILKSNASIIERFKREARIMMDLRDEKIVQVFDHFKEGSSYFIAMEYVDGVSLDKLIQDYRYLSNESAILIFSEICKGLKFAHDKGVIHRDIKPANILISKKGEVKIADFGIATSEEDTSLGLTRAGATLGSPAYMSPEQINDAKTVDKRADIYSMGVMLYKMVTGKLPFPSNISPETVSKIEKGKYTQANKVNPKIRPTIQKVIKKSMHCKKNKRYNDLIKVIKIFKPALSKFKTNEDIFKAVKNIINGKEDANNNIKLGAKKGRIKSFLFKIIPASLLIAILLFVFFNFGFYHEYFKSNQSGSVEFNIDVNNIYSVKGMKDIDIELFSVDKDKYKKVNRIIFLYRGKNKNKEITTYKSNRIFLESKKYIASINIRDVKYEKEIFINPGVIQKQINKLKYKKINIDMSDVQRVPLKANFNFYDIDKNLKINNADIYIFQNNKWLLFSRFLSSSRSSFVSGKTYKFKFIKRGYLANIMEIKTSPGQNILNIDVHLSVIPGELSINSNIDDYKILLNNSAYYFSSGNKRMYRKIQQGRITLIINNIKYGITGADKGKNANIQRKLKKDNKFLLSPGEYSLTIKKGKNEIIKKIIIESNKRISLAVNYDSSTKKLTVK